MESKKLQLHSAYMVGVCVGRVVQNNSLGEIPPEDAEIFGVVAEDTGTIVLIQTMSTREDINMLKTRTPVSVSQLLCVRGV